MNAPGLPPGFLLDDEPAPPPGFEVDGGAAPVQQGRGADSIPGQGGLRAPEATRPPPPKKDSSIADQIIGGVEAGANVLTSLTGGALGLAGGTVGGLFNSIRNGTFGTAKGANDVEQSAASGAQALTYQPRTQEGQQQAETVGEGMQQLVPLAGLHMGGGTPRSGGLRDVARVAGDATRAAGDTAVDAVTPKIAPETLATANKAADAGIPLRPDMLTENKYVRGLGELAEHTPMAGGQGKARRAAFSEGLHKMLDPDGQGKLTPAAYDAAMTKSGETIGDISARTPVPLESLSGIENTARYDTPGLKDNAKTFADDIKQSADENGGIVDGTTFRKFRTIANDKARSSESGDARSMWGNIVKKMDDALSDHAADGDMDALADARRQYAIGLAIADPVAKAGATGDINPALILGRAMKDGAGKRRMARGKGGDLGDYARIGQEFLKEQPSSGSAERHFLLHIASQGASLAAIPFAAAYNLMGPRVAKWMVDRANKRNAPEPEKPAPELTADQTPFDPQGGGTPPASPLGDLTPDWQTQPGAGAPRQTGEPVDAAGLHPAVDEAPLVPPQGGLQLLDKGAHPAERQPGLDFVKEPELHNQVPEWGTEQGAGSARQGVDGAGLTPALGDEAPTTGSGRRRLDIPAVDGKPGQPDVMIAGLPAEIGADEATGKAMHSVGATLAREHKAAQPPTPAPHPKLAEIERLKSETTSDVARKALDDQAKVVQKDIDAQAKKAKDTADAKELRALAAKTSDPELKKALEEKAEKLSPTEKEEPIPKIELTGMADKAGKKKGSGLRSTKEKP